MADDWRPPTEEERAILDAQRKRRDRISELLGVYLLQGYCMLGEHCPKCSTVLMRAPQSDDLHCVNCIDVEAQAATETGQPEPDQEEARTDIDLEVQGTAVHLAEPAQQPPQQPLQQPPQQQPPQPQQPQQVSPPQQQPQRPEGDAGQEPAAADEDGLGASPMQTAVYVLKVRIQQATEALMQTHSTRDVVELCELLSACAIAIRNLKAAS